MLLETKFVSKSWGYEKWLVNNDKYCGKILFVAKDHFCSFHYHKVKDETFYILRGKIVLIYEYGHDSIVYELSKRATLSAGEAFHIPTGSPHRFIALEDTEIIEISTHHEDSDSIRIENV